MSGDAPLMGEIDSVIPAPSRRRETRDLVRDREFAVTLQELTAQFERVM
jgi:hypothetical protein